MIEFKIRPSLCGEATWYINSRDSGLSSTNWGRDHLCVKSSFSLSCSVFLSCFNWGLCNQNDKSWRIPWNVLKEERSYLKRFMIELTIKFVFSSSHRTSRIPTRVFYQTSLRYYQCGYGIITKTITGVAKDINIIYKHPRFRFIHFTWLRKKSRSRFGERLPTQAISSF